MLPLFYGLGVFRANLAFTFEKDDNKWKWNKRGAFSQMEWGYLFALYASERDELNPGWAAELNTSVKMDMERALLFIDQNRELIFSSQPFVPKTNE